MTTDKPELQFLSGDLRFLVSQQTTKTFYMSSEMGMEVGITHFRHIHQPLSKICPQFICFTLLRVSCSQESGHWFENGSIWVLRSGVPLGVEPAGSYVKECACARVCVSVEWGGQDVSISSAPVTHTHSLHHLTWGKFPSIPRRDNISTLHTFTHPCHTHFKHKNARIITNVYSFSIRLLKSFKLLVSSD